MELFEHKSMQPTLKVESSDKTFQTVIRREYISKKLQEDLVNANVLLVPNEGYGDRTDLIYFPSGTTDLYQYLRERQTEDFKIGICIEDKDFKEVALHADWLIIAQFVVSFVIAPLFVDLLAEYIKQHLGKRRDETCVKSRITIIDEQHGRGIECTYEGPAAEYHEVMMKAISKLALPSPQIPEKTNKKRKRRRKEK